LIDGAPEILACPNDRQKDLIEMPFVAGSRPSASQLSGILLAELHAPLANGFIRDADSSGEQQFFDVAKAQAEAEIQPDSMADDLGGEAVVLVTVRRWCAHATSMAHQAGAGQAAQQVDNPHDHPERPSMIFLFICAKNWELVRAYTVG
jgi:hypothetical protein